MSAPTSVFLEKLFGGVVESFAPIGSMANQVLVWSRLFIAGTAQYFLLGVFVSGLFRKAKAKADFE